MRRQLVLTCAALAVLLVWVSPALAFSDVSGTYAYAEAIDDLSSRGIIGGYEDGTFGPENPVTRQQFAKMVVLTLELPVSEADVCPFGDVQVGGYSDPFFPDNYIAVAASRNITTGFPDGTFRPGTNITRAQVVTMAVRAAQNSSPNSLATPPIGYQGTLGGFDTTHAGNMKIAEFSGLLSGLQGFGATWNPFAFATRGEVAQILHNLLVLAGDGQPPERARVVVTSDESVVLPEQGSGYQFAAVVKDATGQILDRPITWESNDPTLVSVSLTGLATARADVGSATITVASPGVDPAVVDVIVATPAPHTLLVSSSDVISSGSSTAVLVQNDRTRLIAVGDTVMSGKAGNLFAKVTSVLIVGNEVNLGIAPAVLTEAFTELDVHLTGLSETATLSSEGVVESAGLTSRTAAGTDLWNISPPQMKVELKEFRPELTIESGWLKGPTFIRLVTYTKATEKISPWTLEIGPKAERNFKYTFADLPVPTPFFIGPCVVTVGLTLSGGMRVGASAQVPMTLNAPTPAVTMEGTNGFQWTPQAGYQTIADNKSPETELVPVAGSTYRGEFELAVSPYIQLDAGLAVRAAGIYSIAGLDFMYMRGDVKCSLGITSQLAYHQAGYTGPRWGADLEFVAGPKLGLAGGITEFYKLIGLDPPTKEWKLYTKALSLVGSPNPEVTVLPTTVKTGKVDLTAHVKTGLQAVEGARVEFVGYQAGWEGGKVLGTGTVHGETATASWQPLATDNGNYQVFALLFDSVFGPWSLPYASSSPAALTVALNTVTLPTAPTNLAAVALSSTSIRFTWADVSNEEGYIIMRGAAGTNWTEVGRIAANVTSFTDTGLAPSTGYWYVVGAYNSAGTGVQYENQAYTMTLAASASLPAAPTMWGEYATTSNSIQLGWYDNSDNETGFIINRASGDSWVEVGRTAAGVTTFTDTGLQPVTTYIYYVGSYNAAGTNWCAEAAYVTTEGEYNVIPPAAPTTPNAVALSSSSIRVTWADVSNEDGYVIFRGAAGTDWTEVGRVGLNVTSFTDTGLVPSTGYWYVVGAYNSAGTGVQYENQAYTMTLAASASLPAAPTMWGEYATTSNSIQLGWYDNSDNETGFIINRASGDSWVEVGRTAAGVTTFTDTGLQPVTTYIYYVGSYNAAGTNWCAEAAYVTTAAAYSVTPPAAPSNLTATTTSSNSIRLTWTDNAVNETGFIIYRSDYGSTDSFYEIGRSASQPGIGGACIWTDFDLQPSTTYYYEVAAYNEGATAWCGWATYATTW